MQQNVLQCITKLSLECRPLRKPNNFPCHQLFSCHRSFRQIKGTLASVTVTGKQTAISLYSVYAINGPSVSLF